MICSHARRARPIVARSSSTASRVLASVEHQLSHASADVSPPHEEILGEDRVRWKWEGQQLATRDPEPNQPSTAMDYIWIQCSDLPEWQPLAARLAEAWSKVAESSELDLMPEFPRPPEVNAEAVHKLIQRIQGEFRYLSVDLESGGWIPAAPAVVARRRYGDCKDLAWLATTVLRAWGVLARPVLVGTGLRDKIAALRPMAQLFCGTNSRYSPPKELLLPEPKLVNDILKVPPTLASKW